MSTLWPFLTNGPNLSPSPYTCSPTPSESCSWTYASPAASVTTPMLRGVDDVSTRPPPENCTPHAPSVRTVAVSAPERTSAVPVPGSCVILRSGVPPATSKRGPRSVPPRWWSTCTPITSSSGEVNVTVTSGRLRVSPRVVSGAVEDHTVSRSSSTRTSATSRGRSTCTPGSGSQ